MNLTLSPAYGRDYKNQKDVKADWNSGKDFIIETIFDPYCGKPCNKSDLKRAGHTFVSIRFNRLTKVVGIPIK